MMDSIVGVIKDSFPFLWASIGLVLFCKIYLIYKMKRFDLAEVLFSFFRIYSSDERQMTSSRKRIRFMYWNNIMNLYVYLIVALSIIILLITSRAK
jgi:hypothetical protein